MRIKYLERKRREIRFSSNALKIVAMISMFIDHLAIMLVLNGKLYGYDASLFANAVKQPEAKSWLILYRICRLIGRISFPIFAFLLVEGFRKTSNRLYYFARILILAFISEIPFNLMLFNKMFCNDIQNVLFTYSLGLIMLALIRLSRDLGIVIHSFILILFVVASKILKTDYWLEGMLLLFVFYEFRQDLYLKCIIALVITFLSSIEKHFGFGIFSIYFILFYDDTKGFLKLKRFPYIFFPLHMIILYLIVYFSYLH